MIHVQKTALVPYSLSEMYRLVSNVKGYPEFLPWCQAVVIESQTETEEETRLTATIKMGSIGLGHAFSTDNILRQNESIHIELLKGPFNHLQGHWHFKALGDIGCKISLDMKFEISNKLLSVSLSPIFAKILNSLIDAFIKQANELYGKS